jgi:hypothetical protein
LNDFEWAIVVDRLLKNESFLMQEGESRSGLLQKSEAVTVAIFA